MAGNEGSWKSRTRGRSEVPSENGEMVLSENMSILDIESMIKLNQQYQLRVQEKISEIQNILQLNVTKQHKLMNVLAAKRDVKYQNSVKCHRKPITLFSAPYFRDVKGFVPGKNEDAATKELQGEVDAYLAPQRPWNSTEYGKLRNGVYNNILQRKITPLKNRINTIEQKLQRDEMAEHEEKRMRKMIKSYKKEIKKIQETAEEKLIEENRGVIDWLTVSSTYMSGCRRAEDCQAMWDNYISPWVNREKFTSEEDEKLKLLAKSHRERNWGLIAEELGTGRTAIQCLERYQTRHNKNIARVYWTPEEDAYLLKVVTECSVGDYIPWHKVMYYIHGRSRMQVTNRWSRNVAPGLKGGPFCTEEDALLLACIQKYGHNWKKISEFLPWRSACACRERYFNFLDTEILTGSWSFEDDLMLLKQIAIHGEGKWAKISKALPQRTDAMCSTRALILKRHNIKVYDALTMKNISESDERFPKEQFAPSKVREAHNETRKILRIAAIKSYNASYRKLTGLRNLDKLKKNEAGIVIPSVKLLMMMRNVLLENCAYIKCLKSVASDYDYGEIRKRFFAKKQHIEMYEDDYNLAPELVDISESDSDLELLCETEGSQKASKEDEEEVIRRLDSLFAPMALTGFRRTYTKSRHCCYRTGKDSVEYDVMKQILFEDFGVIDPDCIVDDNVFVSSRFKDVDFKKTIPLMLRLFVMPDCEDGCLPVICPNEGNVNSTLLCLVNRRQVKSDYDSLLANGSLRNIMAITADGKNSDRRCSDCLQSQRTKEDCTKSEVIECFCDEISMLRQRLMLLRRRFMSVYLLPFMLTKIPMSEDQIKLFFTDVSAQRKEINKMKSQSKKRKGKKRQKVNPPGSDEDLEELENEMMSPRKKKPTRFVQTRTRCVRWKGSTWEDAVQNERNAGESSEEME